MRAAGQPASESAAHQHASSAIPLENGHINHHNANHAAWQEPSEPAEALKGSAKRKRAPEEDLIEAQAKRSKHIADVSLNGQPHDREQQSSAPKQDTGSSSFLESAGSLEWRCQRSCQVSIAGVACASASLRVTPAAQASDPSASIGPHQSGSGGGPLAEGITTGQGLPQLTVTLQCSCQDQTAQTAWQSRSGAQHIGGTTAAECAWRRPRCLVRAEPELPQSACWELAAMAGAPYSPHRAPFKLQCAYQACLVYSASSTERLSLPVPLYHLRCIQWCIKASNAAI